MPIRYRCPACEQLLSISTRMAGREMACPTCGAPTTVPIPEWELPAVAPAPHKPEEPVLSERGIAGQHSADPDQTSTAIPPAEVPVAVRNIPAPDEPEVDGGGFAVRPRPPDMDEMDLTPMVDMTFLLLIFFMITASFSVQKSIEFPPPSPDQKGASLTTHTLEELENNSVIVRIDDRNVIYIDDEPLADAARLPEMLRLALTTQRNELVVTADDLAFHETVVAVIDAASAAGMQKIRLATHARE